MRKNYCRLCTLFQSFLISGVISLIISILLWSLFNPLFSAILTSNMILSVSDNGQLSPASMLWSRPPMNIVMSFTFFNFSNADQVQYHAAKPNITEIGPFSFRLNERKENVKFSDDGMTVFYKSFKQYFYDTNISCITCNINPDLILPNIATLGAAVNIVEQKECNSVCQIIIDIGLLLMGEYPFRRLKPLNVTFYGYNDPLLSFINSPFYKILCDSFNNGKSIIPFQIPHVSNMAFLYNSNNSNDEYYIIETGKRNISSIGTIRSWAGSNLLPSSWWPTEQARMINGTDTGSLAPFYLTENSILPFFSSFFCRSFTAVFSRHSTYKKMRIVEFVVSNEDFDTISNKHIGFRYRNHEKIKYYPNWNVCTKMIRNKSNASCSNIHIDCSLEENLCNECCNGRYVNNTYLLPPGMFPLVCLPGKNETIPLAAIVTPPYFSYSPEEVISSVIGFPRFSVKPSVFTFTREPLTGLLMKLDMQLMISFPMFQTNVTTTGTRLPNLMIPMFIIRLHGELFDDTFWNVFFLLTSIPKFINWLQIIAGILGIFILIGCIITYFVHYFRKTKSFSLVKR